MLRLGALGRGFPSSSAFGVIPTFCSPLFLPSCFRASPGGMWTFISGVAHSVIFFFWGGGEPSTLGDKPNAERGPLNQPQPRRSLMAPAALTGSS